MTTFTADSRRWRQDGTAAVGTPAVLYPPGACGPKVGIQAKTVGGGTVAVEVTMSTRDDIVAAAAIWAAVTLTNNQAVVDNVFTAVRITATTASATYSVTQ